MSKISPHFSSEQRKVALSARLYSPSPKIKLWHLHGAFPGLCRAAVHALKLKLTLDVRSTPHPVSVTPSNFEK